MVGDFDPDAPADGGGLFGLPHTVEQARVRVFPVPYEATTSYRQGTAGGPAAVLEASQQVDLCDLETGTPWRAGIAMEEVDPQITALNAGACLDARRVRDLEDEGGEEHDAALDRVNQASAALNEVVYAWVAKVLAAGQQIPAVLGGDHAVPFGAMKAALEHDPSLGVLHIDAHADLREAYEGFTWSHASIFYNVLQHTPLKTLVQVGLRDISHRELDMARSDERIHPWTDVALADELAAGTPFAALAERIIAPLPQRVWISFDIDGLDPSLCPGTGTPVPGGLSWREALALLAALARSGRQIVGFDLCEVGQEDWDATVGARLLYKLSGWAIASQPTEDGV